MTNFCLLQNVLSGRKYSATNPLLIRPQTVREFKPRSNVFARNIGARLNQASGGESALDPVYSCADRGYRETCASFSHDLLGLRSDGVRENSCGSDSPPDDG